MLHPMFYISIHTVDCLLILTINHTEDDKQNIHGITCAKSVHSLSLDFDDNIIDTKMRYALGYTKQKVQNYPAHSFPTIIIFDYR